jgi:hypothetical protein
MRRLATVLTLLMMFTAANVWAQEKSQVCSLLTAGDVSSIGGTGQGIEGSMAISEGPTKGDTVRLCSWRMPPGGIHLSLAKMPPEVPRETLIAKLNETYALLKAQGWTETKKDFGRISCDLMTPPAGKQDNPYTTGCFTDTKGMLVSVATLSKTPIPMEKVKTLVESAASRVP